MEVQQITMDKNAAREHFLRYRNLVRKRATKEDVALMRGFRALAKGQQVLDLLITMRNAGLDGRLRPRLAICRANVPLVYFRHFEDGSGTFSEHTDWYASRRLGRIRFPEKTFDNVADTKIRWETLKALVPAVPVHLRPAAALSNYHILWEPEWDEEPPRDPLLLKRIARFTFVVLAQWDLTELERSVLRGL